MKRLRLIIVPVLVAFLMSCDSDRQNATLGNTVDTANTEEGAAVPPSIPADSTQKGKDTANGNAAPSGRIRESNNNNKR